VSVAEEVPAAAAVVPADSGGRMVRPEDGSPAVFANYIPPVMEALKLGEVEHNAKNNRMRAR
jgi:hypothetical protein